MANKHRHLLLRIILIILISWAYAAIAVRVADLFLRIAIVVYIFLIAAMAYEACRFGSRFTAVGGWLFIVSDAVLAYNKFVAGIPNAGILIMSTYYLAQLFLFSGTAIKEPTAGNACIPLPRKHR